MSFAPGQIFAETLRWLAAQDARRAAEDGARRRSQVNAAGDELESELIGLAGNGIISNGPVRPILLSVQADIGGGTAILTFSAAVDVVHLLSFILANGTARYTASDPGGSGTSIIVVQLSSTTAGSDAGNVVSFDAGSFVATAGGLAVAAAVDFAWQEQ